MPLIVAALSITAALFVFAGVLTVIDRFERRARR